MTATELKKRAIALAEKTKIDSVTPEEVGQLSNDIVEYIENVEINGSSLGIRKTYTSVSAMEADSTAPKDDKGVLLRRGMLVNIYNQSEPDSADNGKVFSFQNPGWAFRGTVDAGYATKEELSEKVDEIIGATEVVLFDNKELGVRESVVLPTNIANNRLIQLELLTQGLTSNLLWANGYTNYGALKPNFPLVRPYRELKDFRFDFQGAEKISVKLTKLGTDGLIDNADKLLYKGIYIYNLGVSDNGLKVGDQLLFKNVVTEYTDNPQAFFIYKNSLGSGSYTSINANFETTLTVTEDLNKFVVSKPGDGSGNSEIQIYLLSSENKENNQLISKPLSDYDFVAAGDSITAWNSGTDTGVPGVENFDGWANLLNAHIGFNTYKNIAVPGASYIQSSVVGSYSFSINRAIKNGLPEGFSGIFTMMGGTNDYNGTKPLGTVSEAMAKTYDELDQINETSNFSTICDGFRYCLETAIRRCSWKARIFVMTCVPRNDKPEYFTVAEMNEQIKLICKAFNVPVIDLFSELKFRNGLDQFGETWKLSEITDDGGTENVHPNAEAQQMMMRFVFGKLLTYIR